MNILEIKNITKKFNSFTAVDNISFSLNEGEILGFLGPNGAGKTTTIQILLGTLAATRGNVFYFGKNFKGHREEILEQVNFSSTYSNLPGDLTVAEVLTYTSYFYEIKNKKERVAEIKDLFKLEDLFFQQIRELSAGELTRVNLAKSFINFPKVLLLDEPTASLDPEIARYVRDFLLEEKKKFNVSILLTSHNMAEVQEVCDRVIFINEGKIIADDTPGNLARSMKISHVELFFKDSLERIKEYLGKKQLSFSVSGHYICIDIDELKIPILLNELNENKIFYDEISIKKPTLEDYFLEVVTKKPL